MDLAIVGCGGIGFSLVEGVIRIALKEAKDEVRLWLVDGDVITPDNCTRQFYQRYIGLPKSESAREIFWEKFHSVNLAITAVNFFVSKKYMRIHRDIWLKPGVTIFGCVDNDPSRVLLEEEISRLRDGTLIVGGNDEWTGQSQMYIRKNGRDLTPKITAIAPEILTDKEGVPGEGGCFNDPSPQTATTNRMVALAMEIMFRTSLFVAGKGLPMANEIRVNAVTGTMQPYVRPDYGRSLPCPTDSERSSSPVKRTARSRAAHRSRVGSI